MMRLSALLSLTFEVLPLFGQAAPSSVRFDIADVHPSGVAMNPFTLVSGGVLRGDRYDLRKATMLDLVRIAYNVPPETVFGGPNWLEFDRFDIAAKAPVDSSPETVRRMLQTLLAERFHLVVHEDRRPQPAYMLSAGKTKPKLTESSGASSSECNYVQQPAGANVTVYECRNMTMEAFAIRLRNIGWDYLKEPVIDATGIDGAWDFDLRWSPRSSVLPAGSERTTIFDAVSKQLGMSLELREAPAPVLVIDRVEKPAPNAPDVAEKLPPRQLQFEVADLKLNKNGQHGGIRTTRGGVEARGMWLLPLLGFAWDMNTVHTTQRFIGLPKGVDSIYVDINARTEKRANGGALEYLSGLDDDLRTMTRALLTERFQIQWRWEDRPMEAYSLVAAKPKLKKADPANRASCHEARTLANDPRDANPLLSQLISCRNVTLAQFAARLQQIDDFKFLYPVEDATGIEGTWDFDLNFTPGERAEQSLRISGTDAFEPNGAVSLSEAISKELGLRLEKRKRMLPVVVVDHMELKPIEN
jgi:uncharacterized protein (TIGR03435 family)